MNRITPDKRRLILHDLLEGSSQRSCERKHGVSNNTVAKVSAAKPTLSPRP